MQSRYRGKGDRHVVQIKDPLGLGRVRVGVFRSLYLLSMPLVDCFYVAEHHPLLATLQVIRDWHTATGISNLGNVAKKGDIKLFHATSITFHIFSFDLL